MLFSIISRLVGHTHLLFISDGSHANNEASGFSSIPTLHHHPYSACLCSKWNWNSEYIVDPREIRSRGWAVAPGGDGDGVGWDERDAERAKEEKQWGRARGTRRKGGKRQANDAGEMSKNKLSRSCWVNVNSAWTWLWVQFLYVNTNRMKAHWELLSGWCIISFYLMWTTAWV